MKAPKKHFRTSVSYLLVASVLTIFSLSSFAARDISGPASVAPAGNFALLQSPTGTLTREDGQVSINGADAQEGATVLSGSLIRTGTGSDAQVDISSLGMVHYGYITESVLTMSEKSIESSMNRCGSIEMRLMSGITGTVRIINARDVGVFSDREEVDVKVISGQVLVKRQGNKEETLTAGAHEEFDDAIEVTAVGEATFRVYCTEDHFVPLAFLPALGLLLIPFSDDDESEVPVLSPLQP